MSKIDDTIQAKKDRAVHWADEFVQEVIESGEFKPYWVDDMKTPSGRVHIGSVRAVLTHELIYRALRDKKVDATFSYVLEDQDPFDKIPSYLDPKKYKQHLGKQLFRVPSPEKGFRSYGHRWGQEYIDIFNKVGAHPKIIWGSKLYSSGKMNEMIRVCLDNTDKIKAIYKTLYEHKKPSNWYPVNVVCPNCEKLSTTVVSGWDGEEVTFTCSEDALDWVQGCGHKGKISPFDGNGKLPWKVEWPCKWNVIGITIEGAGKDHMSDGGSHDFAKLMCKKVLKTKVPFNFSHEFFLVGGKKMSSSKGVGSSAKEVSKIIPAFLIRFMIARVKYNRAINFSPNNDTIPDLFDAYDLAAKAYWNKSNDHLARVFELSQVEGKPPQKHFLPRFRELARILQDPKLKINQEIKKEKGSELTEQERAVLDDRLNYAKIWLKDYAPKKNVFSITDEISKEVKLLSDNQKTYLKTVSNLLSQDWPSADDLQQALYNESKSANLKPKEAFGAIYLVLIGKNHGPKAAWLLLENKAVAINRLSKLT